MSERKLTHQQGNTAAEGPESLEGLSASKDLHKQTSSSLAKDPANQADLASASISVADVIRASPRTEMRQNISALGTSTETSTEQRRILSRYKRPAETKESGVMQNPHWEYRGDLVSKLVTFLANILKVIERLILKLFGGGDIAPAPQRTQSAKTPQEPSSDPKLEQEQKERDKKGRALYTHRS